MSLVLLLLLLLLLLFCGGGGGGGFGCFHVADKQICPGLNANEIQIPYI